jgi:hypothetical protein
VAGQYSKLETPEAQLEYLLLFVCRSRSASSGVRGPLPNAVQMPVHPPLSPSHPELRVPEIKHEFFSAFLPGKSLFRAVKGACLAMPRPR